VKRPYMKFFPSDWRGDPRLRMCSLSARGLWIDMLSYMHEGEPRGHLTINGRVPKLDEIASLVGRPEREVEKAFGELARLQVFSLANGAIYSRRMVRDEEKAQGGRDDANKGWANRSPIGNPNGVPNGECTKNESGIPNTYSPESRKKEVDANASTPASKNPPAKRGRKANPRQTLPDRWHLDQPDIEFARGKSWNDNKIAAEEQRFADHARAHNRLQADWHAAWRNWVTSPFQQKGQPNGNSTELSVGERAKQLADEWRRGEREAGLFGTADDAGSD